MILKITSDKNEQESPKLDKINVFCFADNENILAACTMITSLICNVTENREIDIYAVHFEDKPMSNSNIKKIEMLKTSIRNFNLIFVPFSRKKIERFNTGTHNPSTLIKLYCAEILPNQIKKALWLNEDTIVNSKIDKLYDTNLRGKYIAATEQKEEREKYLNASIFSPFSKWITAAVVLFNLNSIRKENVQNKFEKKCEFYSNNLKNLENIEHKSIEEYAINTVISEEKFVEFGIENCLMTNFNKKYFEHYKNETKNARILYYNDHKNKPWSKESRNKINKYFLKIWDSYFKKTPFFDNKLVKIGFEEVKK
jgi:lipopolysaccharide biosynthesis glycosyltransferase